MKPYSLSTRVASFGFAIQGIRQFFREEPNAWIHLIATIGVFITGYLTRVSWREAAILVLVTGMVWVAEVFNTAIENIVDLISPDWHRSAGLIKDLSAAAVLLAALTALITGAIIFIPKIF
ncbi:MAG TPA: diacylglycerol kinase family protein [Chitinophagaceae bacterium]|nr:diacylglycerol kinase family protein [Chitinophagaceae bacterium]